MPGGQHSAGVPCAERAPLWDLVKAAGAAGGALCRESEFPPPPEGAEQATFRLEGQERRCFTPHLPFPSQCGRRGGAVSYWLRDCSSSRIAPPHSRDGKAAASCVQAPPPNTPLLSDGSTLEEGLCLPIMKSLCTVLSERPPPSRYIVACPPPLNPQPNVSLSPSPTPSCPQQTRSCRPRAPRPLAIPHLLPGHRCTQSPLPS